MGKKRERGVEPRKTGIRIGFSYNGEYPRETLRIPPTDRNMRYAARKRARILDEIERGVFDYAATFPDSPRAQRYQRGKAVTLRKYLDDWLERVEPTVMASTYRDYRNTVLHVLIPEFGHHAVADLTWPMVRAWAASTPGGNKRISNVLSPLRQALDDAVDDGLITANPLSGRRYRKREAPGSQDDVDPFTQAEQEAIQAALEPQGRNLIRFALWTGLRTSELVALEWGDVDWIRGVALVSRKITQAAKGIAELPKTAAGRREVRLLAPALAALTDQKAHTFLAGGRIFLNPRTGEPWTGDQAIRKTLWAHALKRAGVRYRRPYQTRHTYASMMLSAGEPPLWVASQMGHRDLAMIFRRYGKWIQQDGGDCSGDRAVAAFSDVPSTTPATGEPHG